MFLDLTISVIYWARASYRGLLLLTAFSRWVWASSLFFVCRYSTEPSCRWVRASTLGDGLNWNTACRQWTHRRIFGGLDVRKCSAKPSRAKYQGSGASVLAAMLNCPKTKQQNKPACLRTDLRRNCPQVQRAFLVFSRWAITMGLNSSARLLKK